MLWYQFFFQRIEFIAISCCDSCISIYQYKFEVYCIFGIDVNLNKFLSASSWWLSFYLVQGVFVIHDCSTSPFCWRLLVHMKNLAGDFCKQMLVLGVKPGLVERKKHQSSSIFSFSRLLSCINIPTFVGGFPCGDEKCICGVWSTVGCQSLVLLAIGLAVFYNFFDRDRFCSLWPSLHFVNKYWLILVLSQ